jgi:GNAT superfamily N-acetyltransferase
MSRSPVEIVTCETRQPVAAWLHDELGAIDLLDAEIAWTPERMKAMARMLRAGVAEDDLPQHGFGIQCDGQWQGLMMTTTVGHNARLPEELDKPLVYVKYLESAPWNVQAFVQTPKYRAIGTRLLEAAVRLSVAEGFGGRVGLHALPNLATERFYQRRGLIGLGPDAHMENLPYYEFPSAAATSRMHSLEGPRRVRKAWNRTLQSKMARGRVVFMAHRAVGATDVPRGPRPKPISHVVDLLKGNAGSFSCIVDRREQF